MRCAALILACMVLVDAGENTTGAAEGRQTLETHGVRVVFGEDRRAAAGRVADLSPALFHALEAATGLRFDFQPTVVIAGTRTAFRQMGGGASFVAFAIPDRQQVVLDMSRFNADPASLPPVLKHEYAHLLLHRHIAPGLLPRWLDEGIAQHLSDGLSEYLPGRYRQVLDQALAADRVFSLSALERFPSDEDGLLLAYEQSRSIVGEMVRQYGDGFLAALVGEMAEGRTVAEAFQASSGMSLASFEGAWRQRQTAPLSWVGRMAGHVYGILFFIAAMATLMGFLRHRRRRRAYDAEEDD